jgi:hypothetical protein
MRRLHARILLFAPLTVALVGACALRFEPPAEAALHATLAFPQSGAGTVPGVLLEPLEINGLPRPRDWSGDRLRMPPGEARLLLRAAMDDVHGACKLRFPAVAGETYQLSVSLRGEAFSIRASRDGKMLSECIAPQSVSPTPRSVPRVIPAFPDDRS